MDTDHRCYNFPATSISLGLLLIVDTSVSIRYYTVRDEVHKGCIIEDPEYSSDTVSIIKVTKERPLLLPTAPIQEHSSVMVLHLLKLDSGPRDCVSDPRIGDITSPTRFYLFVRFTLTHVIRTVARTVSCPGAIEWEVGGEISRDRGKTRDKFGMKRGGDSGTYSTRGKGLIVRIRKVNQFRRDR